jgi:hypothetical protein
MPRRTQVDPNQPRAALDPVASPTSRPFVPRLGPETILPVQELAGLSGILGKIAGQQAEERAKVNTQKGLQSANDAPADVVAEIAAASAGQDTAENKAKAHQSAMAKLVQEGKIHVSEDPWTNVGWQQGMAHRLMAGYDAKLNARLAETTATQDEHGDPSIPKSPDAVSAEVWGEYKDNPVLQGYYGSRVAVQMKADADDRFAAQTERQLGENRVKDTTTASTNALTDKLFGLAVSGTPPTPDDWATVKAFGDELYRKTGGVANPRAVATQALEAAAARIGAADGGESGVSKEAEFLRSMRGMPVGNTTAGKDAQVAPKLEDMIAEAERKYKTKQSNLGEVEANADHQAVRTGLREYYAALDKAKAAGGGTADPKAVLDEVSAKWRGANTFDQRLGLVVDAVEGSTLESNKKQGAIQAAKLVQELEAGGNPDTVEQNATLLHISGGMDKDGYDAVVAAVDGRRSVKHLIESSPLSVAAHREIADAAQVRGLPQELESEIGVELQNKNQSLVDDYNRRELSAMSAINALPKSQQEDAARKWHDENDPKLKAELRDGSVQLNKDRAAARAEIVDRLKRSQSAEDLLQTHRNLFAQKEIESFQQAQTNTTDVEVMSRGEEYKDGEAFVLDTVRQKYKDDPSLVDILETGRRELKRSFSSVIAGKLAAVDPAARGTTIRTTAEELADGVVQRVAASRIVRLAEAAKPGAEGVPAANALLDYAEQDLAGANAALKTDDPSERAKVLVAQNPTVPQTIVDYQEAFLKSTTRPSFSAQLPVFGLFQKIERKDLENRINVDGLAALSSPKLSPVAKAQALADMRKITGISMDELSSGKMRLESSADWRAKAEEYLARQQGLDDPRFAPQRQILRAELSKVPTEFPLDGVQIGPYTTPFGKDEAEFRLWKDTREPELRAIAAKYGVPPSSEANQDKPFKDFVRFQKEAHRRLNQEQ